jgi:hypothetical protein
MKRKLLAFWKWLSKADATDTFSGAIFVIACGVCARFVPRFVPAVHELGHTAACYMIGGHVTDWNLIFFGAHTPCTTPTAFVVAAGPFTSVAAWLLLTCLFNWQLKYLSNTKYLFHFAVWSWVWWSAAAFGEFYGDAYHAYSEVIPQNDGGYFVHMTGINPVLAGLVWAGIIAALAFPLVHVGRKTFKLWTTPLPRSTPVAPITA